MTVRINVKTVSRRRPAVEQVSLELEKRPETVSELIVLTVSACVSGFRERARSEILGAMTDAELSDRAQTGKIAFGEIYGETDVDLNKAQENALQCFEDGIYRIFLDEKSLENAEDKVDINENSELTFVRLTMLTGRLW